MFRKTALIGVLCFGLAVSMGVDANAFPPSLAGWSFTLGTVDVNTLWTGVGNYELKPTDIVVTLSDIQVRLYSTNHGGNDGGDGVPFNLTDSLSGTDAISSISKNGKYASTITFEDSDFTSLIDPADLAALLPNPNWTLDPNHVDVLHFRGLVQGFTDISDRCETYYIGSTAINSSCFPFDPAAATRYEEEVVHLEVDCNLQNGAYACTVLQNWEYSKQNPEFP